MSNKARLFVIAAPSGAGKTTLVKELVERKPGLRFSISYTTRKKRITEVEAKDYFFVREAEFQDLEKKGELLESALVFDNHYGTSRSQVEQHLSNGHHVILEIDWQGAQQVRQSKPDCITILFCRPRETNWSGGSETGAPIAIPLSKDASTTPSATCPIGTSSTI